MPPTYKPLVRLLKKLIKMRSRDPVKILQASIPALLSIGLGCMLFGISQLIHIELPSSDHPTQLYSNQSSDDLRATYVQAIDRAEESIFLMIYGLKDPSVITALKKKAAQGVQVQVVYDGEASASVHKKLGRSIRAIQRKSKGIMHQKILVIDEKETWIGSANLTTASLKHHGNLCMGIQHPAVAEMMVEQFHHLARNDRSPPQGKRAFLSAEQELEIWLLPSSRALDRLESLIQQAEKTLRVAMFTWTHPRLTQAMIQAHKRGVDVEVIIDGKAGLNAGKEATRELIHGGVAVRLSHGPQLLHHKFVWVDGSKLAHGSANWTRAAFSKNDDVFCLMHPLSSPQKRLLEKVWTVCQAESSPLQLP